LPKLFNRRLHGCLCRDESLLTKSSDLCLYQTTHIITKWFLSVQSPLHWYS
jgi:hypothetical protein